LSLREAQHAIQLMNWFAPEALNLLGTLREDRRRARKERLRELLAGSELGHMTFRDLKKSHGFEPGEIESIAAHEKWLRIRATQNERGGPRSRIAVYIREHP